MPITHEITQLADLPFFWDTQRDLGDALQQIEDDVTLSDDEYSIIYHYIYLNQQYNAYKTTITSILKRYLHESTDMAPVEFRSLIRPYRTVLRVENGK